MKFVSLLSFTILSCVACLNEARTYEPVPAQAADGSKLELATLAGGCFWCMEAPFEKLDGVHAVVSGYAGGKTKQPTYKQVSAGATGHTEVVQISFNPKKISYETLLDVFWRQINPTDSGGQFVDRGSQYRSEIFFHNAHQQEVATQSKAALEASERFKDPIVTPITPFEKFYPAEDYHQDFYKKDSKHYYRYRKGSGRDQFLEKVWGKDQKTSEKPSKRSYNRPSEQELRRRLSPLQYRVTQEEGTERAFHNEYWNYKDAGIYVDIVSGEPLFSSLDKYKSGTGWPSFTKPLQAENIVEKSDVLLGYRRTELRSLHGDSHLGHVFDDGPQPTGLRYCLNSASLRFIPKADLAKEGYDDFLALFAP